MVELMSAVREYYLFSYQEMMSEPLATAIRNSGSILEAARKKLNETQKNAEKNRTEKLQQKQFQEKLFLFRKSLLDFSKTSSLGIARKPASRANRPRKEVGEFHLRYQADAESNYKNARQYLEDHLEILAAMEFDAAYRDCTTSSFLLSELADFNKEYLRRIILMAQAVLQGSTDTNMKQLKFFLLRGVTSHLQRLTEPYATNVQFVRDWDAYIHQRQEMELLIALASMLDFFEDRTVETIEKDLKSLKELFKGEVKNVINLPLAKKLPQVKVEERPKISLDKIKLLRNKLLEMDPKDARFSKDWDKFDPDYFYDMTQRVAALKREAKLLKKQLNDEKVAQEINEAKKAIKLFSELPSIEDLTKIGIQIPPALAKSGVVENYATLTSQCRKMSFEEKVELHRHWAAKGIVRSSLALIDLFRKGFEVKQDLPLARLITKIALRQAGTAEETKKVEARLPLVEARLAESPVNWLIAKWTGIEERSLNRSFGASSVISLFFAFFVLFRTMSTLLSRLSRRMGAQTQEQEEVRVEEVVETEAQRQAREESEKAAEAKKVADAEAKQKAEEEAKQREEERTRLAEEKAKQHEEEQRRLAEEKLAKKAAKKEEKIRKAEEEKRTAEIKRVENAKEKFVDNISKLSTDLHGKSKKFTKLKNVIEEKLKEVASVLIELNKAQSAFLEGKPRSFKEKQENELLLGKLAKQIDTCEAVQDVCQDIFHECLTFVGEYNACVEMQYSIADAVSLDDCVKALDAYSEDIFNPENNLRKMLKAKNKEMEDLLYNKKESPKKVLPTPGGNDNNAPLQEIENQDGPNSNNASAEDVQNENESNSETSEKIQNEKSNNNAGSEKEDSESSAASSSDSKAKVSGNSAALFAYMKKPLVEVVEKPRKNQKTEEEGWVQSELKERSFALRSLINAKKEDFFEPITRRALHFRMLRHQLFLSELYRRQYGAQDENKKYYYEAKFGEFAGDFRTVLIHNYFVIEENPALLVECTNICYLRSLTQDTPDFVRGTALYKSLWPAMGEADEKNRLRRLNKPRSIQNLIDDFQTLCAVLARFHSISDGKLINKEKDPDYLDACKITLMMIGQAAAELEVLSPGLQDNINRSTKLYYLKPLVKFFNRCRILMRKVESHEIDLDAAYDAANQKDEEGRLCPFPFVVEATSYPAVAKLVEAGANVFNRTNASKFKKLLELAEHPEKLEDQKPSKQKPQATQAEELQSEKSNFAPRK